MWFGGSNYLVTTVPKVNVERGVVDFVPFRREGVVDVALERTVYDSLTQLELTFRPDEAATEWPKRIWQTSPTAGDTEEMKTWKVMNPDWRYKVSIPRHLLMDSITMTRKRSP